ncbi:MAG TPA: hypothetical protein VGB75_02065 [Jatrophihabitans sp.]|uniref:hypothetical protein n=1 Tax=Jatrophihabitans sp. TaxID=1932789 RepID=UPI002F016D4D
MGPVPAAPTWEQVLADLELETTALQEGLRRGELLAPVTPWHPPVLPPIPAELVARAQALLDQQLRLQIQISLELDRAPAASRPRSANRPDPAPQLVDLKA